MSVKQDTKNKSKPSGKVTPLMKQYFKVKSQHPEAILLFRVGDFYETFGEDAVTTADTLGIVLTSRNNGGSDIALAGFPYHALDLYMPRLIKAGFRVALCEQLEKPSKEKKIVKRGVTEVITPGLTTQDSLLNHKENNFLCSIHYAAKEQYGIAFLDISTGEFLVSEGDLLKIQKLIEGFQPSEIIVSKSNKKKFEKEFGDRYYHFTLDEWVYSEDYTNEKLTDQFEVQNFKGFGISHLENAQIAAGSILHYLQSTENTQIQHINGIQRIHLDDYMWLDKFTIQNLELIHKNQSTGASLIDILDHCTTPMGSRLLKKWILLPLINRSEIENRLTCVEYFYNQPQLREQLIQKLKGIGDLERLVSRIPSQKINPREVLQLKKSLSIISDIKTILSKTELELLHSMGDGLHECNSIKDRIEKELSEEAPGNIAKGNLFNDGWHDELDELNSIIKNSKSILVELQEREAEKTGIAKLKIGFNNVFGYYLEVTNKYKNLGLVPDEWVRKQTLSNSERYITDELKKLETKILGAEEKLQTLELDLYEQLVRALQEFITPIQHNAQLLAKLDVLISLAHIAVKHEYNKPTISDGFEIDIKDGRHPVIEQFLDVGEFYVPNDVFLDRDEQQILMITGPNMSGKSAVLRQTALITLLAQIGSFVPAKEAKIGIVDRLFTRVGASDNISSGESTFMVEMNETASIMNNISERSLILLDEIGRGTSTYDGISIAWSLAEYLHDYGDLRPKTLFATHYHELNELANRHERVQNFNISIKEVGNQVIFLRKLVPGGSEHSFGIHVAKMAGMPKEIILRAGEILLKMEEKSIESKDKASQIPEKSITHQLSIFETVDETAGELKSAIQGLDLNSMTPIECMMKLHELTKLLDED